MAFSFVEDTVPLEPQGMAYFQQVGNDLGCPKVDRAPRFDAAVVGLLDGEPSLGQASKEEVVPANRCLVLCRCSEIAVVKIRSLGTALVAQCLLVICEDAG